MNVFEELASEFLRRTSGFHGMVARPNDTHYSLALVTQALQWLRADLSEGKELTPEGQRFVAAAAAHLGYLAHQSFERRGLDVELSAEYELGSDLNHLVLLAARQRDGERDTYDQDFFRDMHETLLRPPRGFPSIGGRTFVLESLSLPSVEYLYLLGVHFLDSPFAGGDWPEGDAPGGTEEDFAVSRKLLVDDLHADINVPTDREEFRQLSHWVVWPPYGWDQNDGQRYNMMTLIDQIAVQKLVPLEEGVAYLRALLCSQVFHLRNLAARTLMVLGQPPAAPEETIFYLNAVNASDAERATGPMVRFRWVLEGHEPDTSPGETFVEETGRYWREMLRDAPREDWTHAPILRDPLYRDLADRSDEDDPERMEKIEALRAQYPEDWFADVAYGYTLLDGADPALGETLLQEAIEQTPGDTTAHTTLGRWYLAQGRWQEAAELYARAVKLRPWDPQTVSNAMWFLTRRMVS